MTAAIALDLGTTTIKAGLLFRDGSFGGVVARASPKVTADGGRYESDALATRRWRTRCWPNVWRKRMGVRRSAYAASALLS